MHEAVRTSGAGAYSHWGRDLYFSASDNSDPRSNGRVYRLETKATFRTQAMLGFLLLNAVCAAVFLLLSGRPSMVSSAAIQGILTAAVIGFGFSMNAVPVNAVWGRFFHGAMAFFILMTGLFFAFMESRRTAGVQVSVYVKMIRSLQLVLMLFLFFVLSLESLCRAFPVRDTLAVNPGCRFFWSDWYHYPLNKQGYREREIPAKEQGVYRILIYGDSYVEGAGVDRASLAGVHLEQLLNGRLREAGSSLRVQAFNLGHCGANTRQEAFWIERDAPLLKPDLVVLAYVLNDAESEAPTMIQRPSPLMQMLSSFLTGDHGSYLFYRWLKFSALFFSAAKIPTGPSRTYIETLHEDDSPGWLEAQRALGRIKEFTADYSIDQFTVILPLFLRSVLPDMVSVMNKVSGAMTALGMENFNTLEYFSRGGLLQYAFSANDSHPNSEGHRKLAEYLSGIIWDRESFQQAAGLIAAVENS